MERNLAARRALGGRPAWKVSLDGFASHTGSRDHNLALSANRERAVQDFLTAGIQRQRPALFDEVVFDPHFHGFDDTPTPGQNPNTLGEDPARRSVRIVVHPPTRKPQPRPIPNVEAGSTRFQIRLLGLISAGFVVSHDDAFFEITDLVNRRKGQFQFLGGGISVPVPKLPFFSVTTAGPPQHFATNRPVSLIDFNGPAEFGQPPSAGPFSSDNSQLHINSRAFLTKGARTIPRFIPVPTGVTAGVTIFSSTEGVLIFHGEGPA